MFSHRLPFSSLPSLSPLSPDFLLHCSNSLNFQGSVLPSTSLSSIYHSCASFPGILSWTSWYYLLVWEALNQVPRNPSHTISWTHKNYSTDICVGVNLCFESLVCILLFLCMEAKEILGQAIPLNFCCLCFSYAKILANFDRVTYSYSSIRNKIKTIFLAFFWHPIWRVVRTWKNKETSTGRCVVWNICSLLVQKNSRFGLRGMQ